MKSPLSGTERFGLRLAATRKHKRRERRPRWWRRTQHSTPQERKEMRRQRKQKGVNTPKKSLHSPIARPKAPSCKRAKQKKQLVRQRPARKGRGPDARDALAWSSGARAQPVRYRGDAGMERGVGLGVVADTSQHRPSSNGKTIRPVGFDAHPKATSDAAGTHGGFFLLCARH